MNCISISPIHQFLWKEAYLLRYGNDNPILQVVPTVYKGKKTEYFYIKLWSNLKSMTLG